MTGDQYFYLYLSLILSVLPTVLHFARTRITLGPFFGLSGVYSILLWQLLQTGWWVKYADLNFNAGLTLFVPPILLGSLLTFAFDGLRTARSYLAMVATACLAGWLFSLLRESLAAYAPLPYLIVQSNREHIGIILGFMIAQMVGMAAYLGVRKWHYFLALPVALLASIAAWLGVYSVLSYGFEMGLTNLSNDLLAYYVAALPVVLLAGAYGVLAQSRGLVMPARTLRNLLTLWKPTASDRSGAGDELTNRDEVISELKLLNQQLDTNGRLMEHHMAHASYGIVITDGGGKVMRANLPAGRILANDALEGKRFETVLNRILAAPLKFADLALGNFPDRLKTAPAAGDQDWIEVIVTPLKDSDSNQVTGYYLLIKDLTERIRADHRKLAESRAMVSAFSMSAKSKGNTIHLAPSTLHKPAKDSNLSCCLAERIKLCLPSAYFKAKASPIPLLAPVIQIVFLLIKSMLIYSVRPFSFLHRLIEGFLLLHYLWPHKLCKILANPYKDWFF